MGARPTHLACLDLSGKHVSCRAVCEGISTRSSMESENARVHVGGMHVGWERHQGYRRTTLRRRAAYLRMPDTLCNICSTQTEVRPVAPSITLQNIRQKNDPRDRRLQVVTDTDRLARGSVRFGVLYRECRSGSGCVSSSIGLREHRRASAHGVGGRRGRMVWSSRCCLPACGPAANDEARASIPSCGPSWLRAR